MSYGDRIKKIRKHFKLTQQELADAIGAKNKQTISDVENGKQKHFNKEHELMLTKKFLISQLWLNSGEGDMLLVKQHDDIVREDGLIYNKVSDNIKIPYYPEIYASAGGGAFSGFDASSPVSISRGFLQSYFGIGAAKGMHIINVVGDSMAPTLKNGEMIFVNPIENEGFRDGGVYVLMCGDTILVKRVRQHPITKEYTLISDNPEVEDITLTIDESSDCKFVGRVVGSMGVV